MSKDGTKDKTDKKNAQQQLLNSISAGNTLQTLRIEHGWQINDVAEATKISTSNLRAIENADYGRLPADTFARGLLVIYANHLNADTEQIVRQFFQERDDSRSDGKRSKQKKTGKILAPKTLAEPSHISSAAVAGVIFLLIIILFTSYCFYTSWNPFSTLTNRTNPLQSMMKSVFTEKQLSRAETLLETNTIDNQSLKETKPAIEFTQQSAVADSDKNEAQTGISAVDLKDIQEKQAPVLYTLTALFLKDTQVESISDELAVVQHTFQKGDQHKWNARHSLTLIFKTPDSAELQLNGEKISFPKFENEKIILRIPEIMFDL